MLSYSVFSSAGVLTVIVSSFLLADFLSEDVYKRQVHGVGLDAQNLLNVLHQLKGVAGFAVHLVDEGKMCIRDRCLCRLQGPDAGMIWKFWQSAQSFLYRMDRKRKSCPQRL